MMAGYAGAHRAARRTRRVVRPLRLLVMVAAVLVGVLTLTQVALAYFGSTGNGIGSATTGTLAAPTSVAGSQTPGTGTVTVTWTASAGSPAPTGYYVRRLPTSGPAQPACGTSAASTTASTSCADTGVALGTYTYEVVAVYRTWTATSAASASVTVAQATQTIVFTSSPVSPTHGGSYTVSAVGGGSGNPVTFSSGTPGVCTVAGSSVSFAHAGTCTINANQAASTYYAAAPQSQQTFTIAKAAQTVAFTSTAPSGAVVGGAGYTPAATGGGSGNPVIFTIDATTAGNCSISGGVVIYQHAGTCTVDANQAGNVDYLAASQVQQSYTVGKGAQAITYSSSAPLNAKVGGATYTVTATGGLSGNAVTFSSATTSVCTVSGSTVSFVGAGTCTVNANQAGNADYNAASQVQQSFVVTRQDQTITFTSTAPSGATVGGTYAVSATASSGLPVAFTSATISVCTVSGSTVTFAAAGTCTINANQAGDGTYNAAPQVQQSFTVTGNTFAITGRGSVSPQNTTTVSGTGNPGATITVYLCNGTQAACGPSGPSLVSNPNFANPQTTTVLGNGTWSVIFSKVNNSSGVTYTLQARQSSPNLTSSVLVFTTS